MKKIKPDETLLKGNWKLKGTSMVNDEVSQRIEWLTTHQLQKITTDESGWHVLFQDRSDGRYWELTYPESELHGGGAPQLQNISDFDAKKKYKI